MSHLTVLSLINIQILLISIPIVALSITNFYFTGHALQTFARYFPAGYDVSPENMVLVSTAFSIVAGLFGVAGFWIARTVSHV
jgi:hypothetical protein